jgi:hypothetical protein
VEASGSLSVAETIEVENPSVSSLLTTVQKYREARGGSFKDIEVVVAKNASVEKMVGKQVRVGNGVGRPFGGRGGCCRGFGNSGFVSVCCEAGLSSKARIGDTRKIDLPSLPLDNSF